MHSHAGVLLNDRDGTSARALRTPALCSVVSGHACVALSCKASACTRCSTMSDHRNASRVTQLTIGELSLKSVTLFSLRLSHTPFITIHSMTMPAISRSEFDIQPAGFLLFYVVFDVLSPFSLEYDRCASGFLPKSNSPCPMFRCIDNANVIGPSCYQFLT